MMKNLWKGAKKMRNLNFLMIRDRGFAGLNGF